MVIADWLAELPAAELKRSLAFLAPLAKTLADRRLQRALCLPVRRIFGRQAPVITVMAQTVSRLESETWPAAKRIYRFL